MSSELLCKAVPQANWRPSPNFDSRPPGTIIDTVILHSDTDDNVAQCIAWITQRKAGVTYHASFGHEGALYTHVDDKNRAWHALGNNRSSIGLNLSNKQDGKHPYPPIQIHSCAAYIAWVLMKKYPAITLSKITTHYLVDTVRHEKRDPWPNEPTFNLEDFRALVKSYFDAGLPQS